LFFLISIFLETIGRIKFHQKINDCSSTAPAVILLIF
jgi:hypothetical protein